MNKKADADRVTMERYQVQSPYGTRHLLWFNRILAFYKLPETARDLFNGGADISPKADLTVIDPDVETALRIVAYPRFVHYGGAVPTVVRKGE